MLIRVKPTDSKMTSSIAKSEPEQDGSIMIEHTDLGAAQAHGYEVAHLPDAELPEEDAPDQGDGGEDLKPIGERRKRKAVA